MYLCLGVFMTLLKKNVFGKPNFATQQNIFETIHNKFGNFEYAPLNKTTLSKCFNCEREINGDVVQEITRLKKEDPSLLFDNFRAIAIDLQKNIIAESKQTDLVTVIIYIIEHDPEISASTIIGISEYYTRNNLLHAKQINLIEFLENILYFVFCERKNNDSRGNETVEWIKGKKYYAVLSEQLDINLITHNQTNEQNNIFNLNDTTISSIKYPRKLTEYSVIGATKKNILFRDSEYANIINSFHSGVNSILLHGFGGCGKTSLARLIYYTTKDCYDCFGWVNYSKNLKESLIDSIKPFSTSAESDSQKKWHEIEDLLTNRSISKLIVIDNIDFIDGIQNPLEDTDLFDISSWSNTKVIATSRLSHIEGFDEIFEISNLGNNDDYSKCIDLFYHYNPKAKLLSNNNEEDVKKICALASYNTMVIELLAKSSLYNYNDLNCFYDNLCKIGFHYTDEIPVTTDHEYTEKRIASNGNKPKYKTAASQLIALFNLKERSEIEQQIVWEFHCLHTNAKITPKELCDILGYSMIDIIPLEKEGWITFEDGYFSIHPLIQRAVETSAYFNTPSDNSWKNFWENGIKIRTEKKNHFDLISRICKNNFELSFLQSIKNPFIIYMLPELTLMGTVLDNTTLFNLGYKLFNFGYEECANIYISTLYKRIVNSELDINCSDSCELWGKIISLRYMLETEYRIIDSQTPTKPNDTSVLSLNNIILNAIVLLFLQHNTITKFENSITNMTLHLIISDYILSFCSNDNSNDKPLENAFKYVLDNNSTKGEIYCNGKLAFSLPNAITIKSKTAICLSFLKFIEKTLQPIIDKVNCNTMYFELYSLTMYNLGRCFYKLNLSRLIKNVINYHDPIIEFGHDNFQVSLTWNDIFYAYKFSKVYYEKAIYYQLKAISLVFPNLNNTNFKTLIRMCHNFSLLLKNIPSSFEAAYIFEPNLLYLCRQNSTNDMILWIAKFTNKYGSNLAKKSKKDEYCLFYFNLSLKCYSFILENSYIASDETKKEIEQIELQIKDLQ